MGNFMSALNVWLIRHGESTVNAGLQERMASEVTLTPKGIEQAKEAAQQIINPPNLIITSPLQRAQDSVIPIQQRWPQAPIEIWPIQEIHYIDPKKLNSVSGLERSEIIADYWERGDPFFCDGCEAESFATFIQRVRNFYQKLLTKEGFIVVVGHGQFFKAFLLGLAHGFAITPQWMQWFREQETQSPINNSEIYKLQLKT
jgi:broad specificity phosphatase PhoE